MNDRKNGTSKPRLNRDFKPMEDLFIIFADLDGTFTPMTIEGKIDFVTMVKEILSREQVKVKFVPVSGRPAGYVLRVLHEARDMLGEYGIKDICDFGAAESGALIVDSKRSYGPEFTGHQENIELKKNIDRIIKANKYADIISDEPDKLYTCSIHIHNEAKEDMSQKEQLKIYTSIKNDIVAEYGDKLDISFSHNSMELMSKEISKAKAICQLTRRYAREYNVVGLLYAGDAENDKVAMKYVSKLAEIPGINSHNFVPGNAQEAVLTKAIEPWKYDNLAAHEHYVERSEERLFKGITDLVRRALDQRRLCGKGVQMWRTRDDTCPQHVQDLRAAAEKLRKRREKARKL